MACRTSSIKRHPRRRGFGVAEALMASVILAIAVVGIAGPLSAAGEQVSLVQERSTALVLARELLEEIATKPLLDSGTTAHLGSESGETDRSKFNSADDYHLYRDSTAEMNNLSGRRVGLDSSVIYTRDVTVEYRTSISGTSATSGDFGLVTVAVTTPHKYVVTVSRLMCKSNLAF